MVAAGTESLPTVPVTLQRAEAVERIRLAHGHLTSAHAFPSLWLWREEMELSLFLEEDLFAVRCGRRGKNTWFFPCGERQAVRAFLERAGAAPEFALCYVRTEDCAFLEREFPGRFRLRERPDDSEYLYDAAGQRELCGGSLRKVRQAIVHLEKNFRADCEPLTAGNLAEALAVVRAWKPHSAGACGLSEHGQAERFLNRLDAFGGSGVLVRLDGTAVSVMAGCPIGPGLYDGMVSKQSVREPGLFEYTWRSFFARLPERYALVNMEEDLGIPGLRLMKRRLRPEGMIRMFDVVSQGQI